MTHTEDLIAARKLLGRGEVLVAQREYAAIAASEGTAEARHAALCGLGESAILLGDFASAIDYFARAEAIAGDEHMRTVALARRITSIALGGDPVRAVALGEASVGRLKITADHQAIQARLLAALIMPYTQIGAFERVSEVSRQALALSSRVPDPALLAYLHRAVTHAFVEQHRFDEALSHADKAMRLSEQLDMPIDVGLCRLACASALKDADRLAEAAEELLAAIAIFDETGAAAYRARATAVLAEVRLHQGDPATALALTAEVGEIDPWTLGYASRVAGMAAAECGDFVRAQECLSRSADLFTEQGGRVDLVETCREWGRLLAAQGRLAEAVEVYDRGLRGASTVAHA
jgi:tetratricopeptide (TPR) repeat protein